MHPILKRRSRLVLYLAVGIVFGLLLTVVLLIPKTLRCLEWLL